MMPAAVEWGDVKKLDPATLHERYKEELDSVINLLTSVWCCWQRNVLKEEWEVERRGQEDIVHILRVFQSLLKMKQQEANLAEQLVEEQEKNENTLLAKVSRLEEELTYGGTGPENRFLRNDIRQLKSQLVRKDEMVNQLRKEIKREKKTTEKLFLRAEAAEDNLKTLKRENAQLQQDVDFYHGELELKESDVSKEDNAETQKRLISVNRQLSQCMDDLRQAEDEISQLKEDNLRMQKCVMESTKEMEKMSDEYNQIKMAIHQCDSETDQLKKERDLAELLVRELTQKINNYMTLEDDPIMAQVDAQVEEWKKVLFERDEEILAYQQTVRDLQQKLCLAQMDMDQNNILDLEQVVEERDNQIKILREQVEQYTREMEKQTLLMESLKVPKIGHLSAFLDTQELVQYRKIEDVVSKWDAAEMRATEAQEALKRVEVDAEEKDRELIEASKRLKEYEQGIYGLEEANHEIKECKIEIRRRELELEAVTKEINQAFIIIDQLTEENEDFRERLGYETSQEVDLSEFRRAKSLKQRQYKAENQILTKEIERLEEERLAMKKQVRQLAKQKGLPPSMLEEDNVIHAVKWPSTLTQNSNARKNVEPQPKIDLKEEAVMVLKTEEAVTKSKTDEAVTKSKTDEAVLKSKTDKAVTKSKMEEAVTKWRTDEAVTKSKMEEAVTKSKMEEAVTKSKMDEAVTKSKTEEAVLKSKTDKAVTKSKMEEAVTKSKMDEAMTMMKREADLNNSQFQFKLAQLSKEKEDLETVLKEVLQALKAKDTANIPSLKKLANRNLRVFVSDMVASLQEEHVKALHEKTKAEQESMSIKRNVDDQEQRLREMTDTCRSLEKELTEKSSHEADGQEALTLAQKSVKDLQSRLSHKENVIKKYQHRLTQLGKHQEKLIKKHAEEMKMLYQKVHSNNNMALDRFTQQAAEALLNPGISASASQHLDRLGELEQLLAEQEASLASVNRKLKLAAAESERHKTAVEMQAKKHAQEISRLKRSRGLEDINFETKDLKSQIAALKKERDSLRNELESPKEANDGLSPGNTLTDTVERFKMQLLHKEKQIKALSKVLIGMRAQMTSAAQQQILANSAQSEEKLNIQKLIDKHTKDLQVQVQTLSEELEAANDSSRKNESRLKAQVDNLNKRLQRSLSTHKVLHTQLEEREQELNQLEKQIKVRVDPIQSKEKVMQWEETKKWQTRLDKLKSVLKDKEEQNYFLSKQLSSMKELYARLEHEKTMTQKKTKAKPVTAKRVIQKETQLVVSKQQPTTNAEIAEEKTQSLEERLRSLEKHMSDKSSVTPLVLKKDAETATQSDADLQKENLKLASENLELRLQLAQANIELPRFKRKVAKLEEMCSKNAESHTCEVDMLNFADRVGAEIDFTKEDNELWKNNVEWEQKPDKNSDSNGVIHASDTDTKEPRSPEELTEIEKNIFESDMKDVIDP
ncbi:uncharacterized protein LOC144016291 [Festucalex cinctus]